MILKKDKEVVLDEIRSRVMATVSNEFYNNQPVLSVETAGLRVDTSNLNYMLQKIIASAIEEGFRTLLENRYTDDDFERDMNLK